MKLSSSLLGLVLAALSVRAAISEIELKANTAKGLRLISLEDGVDPVWKTEDEKLELMRAHRNFFDVTEVYEPNTAFASPKSFAPLATYPSPSHQSAVNAIIQTISLSNMQSYLGNLTAFNNRYYKSTTGAAATDWIVKTAGDIAARYPASGATVSAFKHSWVQGSIIARIPGTTSGPVTIIGAHMDSINLSNPTNGRAPGADDDGSGSVNLMEAFRALLASGFKPRTPVEFQWYSGEEAGLLGSQAIAKSYKAAGTQVKAMMQLDMTAYVKPGTKEVIGLMPDYIDAGLNTFLGSVIDTYSLLDWTTSPKCGYACSDHASWYNQGYPSCLPFESRYGDDNPLIHSASDTTSVNGFSWTHTLEYTKIAVAFAYELGI
ncbi:hypothetical protein BDZ94DRAFT_1239317 [Collybia nuda]|uniref:Peptide hydrolase n=1 Tax=Collybia nuda TaxID=64659 RepID=A0A9P5XZ80_9AGAR|nr:hypothetical protein BDZ94DRAFT_1239317 [Collybia nuda]